jgi:hypothetical protein
MTRSPDSLIPFDAGQLASEKRDDKAFNCRQGGEANLRAATEVNVVSASSTPPVITPIQLDLFPGRACSPEAKPATVRSTARRNPSCRDGVEDGGTQRQTIELTGETLFGPAEETSTGREAYKGSEVDPIFWTKKEHFLDGGGALKMKERQCPQPVRIIRPA